MRKAIRDGMQRNVALAGLLVFSLLFSQRGNAEDIPTSQVMKELRSGIARLQATEIRLTTWECVPELSRGGGKPNSGTFLVKRHGASVLVNAAPALKPDQYRTINNDVEMFSIESKTSGRTWVLRNYQKRKAGDDTPRTQGDDQFAICPLTAVNDNSTILQLVDKKTFTAVRARKVAENRVELDYELTDGDAIGRGTLTLAPDLDWLVIRSVYTITSKSGDSGRVAFSRDAVRDGDLIRVKSANYEAGVEGKPQFSNKSKYAYKLLAPETVAPAEFTIEYYKLTSPESVEAYEDRPPFNWRLWGSVGVICITLSLVLAWIVRRRRA